MADLISQFRDAGFSDQEIGDWSTGFRSQMKDAGFKDDEVDSYLTGAIPTPGKPPQALLNRLQRGSVISKAIEAGKAAVEGFGPQPPSIFSEDFEKTLRGVGIIGDPDKGTQTPLQFMNEALLRPLGAVANTVGRAIAAGEHGIASYLSQTVEAAGGSEQQKQAAEREALNLMNFLMAQGASHAPLVRPGATLTGQVVHEPIGTLPKGEDFLNAAKSTVGSGDTPFQLKLRSLYEDKGLLPAEVAADAEKDVTVSQALASRGKDLPERYGPEAPRQVEPESRSLAAPPPTAEGFPSSVQSYPPSALTVDADRFQFKSGADEAGVTDRLRGVTEWDPVKAGLGLVWEDNQGQRFVVDGHQRLDLARRIAEEDPAQNPRMNAITLREADGVSDVEARVIAASKNIAEGTGTAIDAAKILRDRPDLIKTLPPRSELVRQARGLANLSDESFGMVVNEVVPPNYAAIVGRLVPDDEKLQGAVLGLLAKTEPANAVQAESIVRQGIEAGTRTETQATLFGDQEVVSSLFLDRAKVLDRALRELKRDRMVFSTIVREQDILEATGNRLETSANAQRAAADAQAVQILQVLANRRGPLSDALNTAASRAAGGDTAGAARDFVAAIRSQAESGDLIRAANSLERGRTDAAGENAANIVDPAARPVSLAGERAATETAQRLITEQTEQGEQVVMPGMERSAQQAMEAREAEGGGRIAPPAPQEAPGGLFAPKEAEQGTFLGELKRLAEEETGALYMGRPRPPPAPGSLEEARESIRSKISVGEPSQRRPYTLSRLYTDTIDRLYPLSEATPAGRPTPANPYRLSRLLSGLAGKVDHFLKEGTFEWQSYRVNGPSFEAVLAPVARDLANFRDFAVAARGLELEARGIETGLDAAAMRQVVRQGINQYGPALEGLVEYQNRVAAYARDAGLLSQEGYDAMVDANQLYVPFQRIMGDGDGYHPAGAGQGLQASNPIQRIKGSEREIIDPIESVIRNTAAMITAAEKNAVAEHLVDMLASAGQLGRAPRTPIAAVTIAADPALDAALTTYLQAHGVQQPQGLLNFLKAAAEHPADVGTVRVFRKGTPYAYQVDPEIAIAMKGLDAATAGLVEKLMAPFARVLRAGAVLTPDFALRHTIRDFLYAATTSRGFFTPADMARGFLGLVSKDPDYWRWLQGGGANISMVSLDRRYLQESVERLTGQTGLMTKAWNVVADPNSSMIEQAKAIGALPFNAASKYVIHPLQVLTELAENASHLGAFKREMRAFEASGVPIAKEEIQQAAFTSRDVAVDAARIGAKTRGYNAITAFANIKLQDSDRVVRAFVNDPAGTALKIGLGITVPSALLWWAQHDDPRYKEIPQWQKDLFWVVLTDKWEDAGPAGQYGPPHPESNYRVQGDRLQINNGAIFRVPKPWGMGLFFGSAVERSLEALKEQSAEAFAHFSHSIFHVAGPDFIPTAVGPILNQWTNRDTFTNRTLIPGAMEKILPEYQYTPYTTESTKALGQMVGAFPGIREYSLAHDQPLASGVARALSSPILIENYIRGWSGTLGVYALQTADAALRKARVVPDPALPASTLADIPVVRAFVIRYPTATTQSLQDFDDRYAANRVYYDTWLAKAREGDAVAALRIQGMGGPRMFVQLDQIKQTLAEHNKLIRDIYKDPGSTPTDKRQLIDTIYYRMIELGKIGKQTLDTVDRQLAAQR